MGAARHESVELLAREAPLEGPCDPLIVLLKAEDACGDLIVRGEVGRGEDFALQDREVDLDLVMEILSTTSPKSWARWTSHAAM